MFFDGERLLGRNEQKAIINEIKKRWNRKQLDARNPDKKIQTRNSSRNNPDSGDRPAG
ncbi:hypothetical protein PSH58_03860 [Pseudomonas hefeiensis]|uniref:Uncharacterized protein n=1 Tax=Pseudomonas hefeiensis TaxID=2738125 RepID=A0ABY9GCY5_9PSED|nr:MULTISPECIES: hypothetical protein [unclassified Pseudomonas]WLH13508.1 hypothetical protein PSH57_03865 [Pseudomonas sp. FP205]WLH96566.1 hypothetical protein PSH58_03860 [Pseudomonas sp. FP53]WLI40843.1 hypothetical protein PSH74_03865 [Pseudomonas sp. FP821]